MDEYTIDKLNTHNFVIKSEDERIFEGYISVETKDRDGEITIVSELLKTMDVWFERGAPMSYGHSNKIIGKGLSYEAVDYHMPDGTSLPAIKMKGKVYASTELDNLIWERIKSGQIRGLSYGGATKSSKIPQVQNDGSIVYLLKDLEVYEVALCEQPTNNFALITQVNHVAKSQSQELLKGGIVRGNDEICLVCDGVRCVVEKSEKNASNSNNLINSTNLTDTVKQMPNDHKEKEDVEESETEKSQQITVDMSTLNQLVEKGVKAALFDLNKEDDKEEDDDEKEDSSDAEKGVSAEDFATFVDLMKTHVEATTKFNEEITKKFEDIEKESVQLGSTDGMSASNAETVKLPDEDSEQADMDPHDDNKNDEVHIAKAQRPSAVDTAGESPYVNNPILEDMRKGVAMDVITKKINNHVYDGGNEVAI